MSGAGACPAHSACPVSSVTAVGTRGGEVRRVLGEGVPAARIQLESEGERLPTPRPRPKQRKAADGAFLPPAHRARAWW